MKQKKIIAFVLTVLLAGSGTLGRIPEIKAGDTSDFTFSKDITEDDIYEAGDDIAWDDEIEDISAEGISEEDTSEGDAYGEDTSEGDASEGDASEGDTSEEDASEGDTSEGDASEGDTFGEDTSGEDIYAEDIYAEGISEEDTSEDNTSRDQNADSQDIKAGFENEDTGSGQTGESADDHGETASEGTDESQPQTDLPSETAQTETAQTETAQTETTETDPLELTLETKLACAVADETEITYLAEIQGGTSPYHVVFRTTLDDHLEREEEVESDDTTQEFTWIPTGGGLLKAKLIVTDADGKKEETEARILPVAVREEYEADWKKSATVEELTGDWRKDLVSVAISQVGYRESEKDFIIDEDGNWNRCSRYAGWYDDAYGTEYRYDPWDAMFVSFCLNYAEVSEEFLPRGAASEDWITQLEESEAFQQPGEGYQPEPGDLIFLTGDEEEPALRTAIVEEVSREDGQIGTIEGYVLEDEEEELFIADLDEKETSEAEKEMESVIAEDTFNEDLLNADIYHVTARRSYDYDDEVIAGYVSMRVVMKLSSWSQTLGDEVEITAVSLSPYLVRGDLTGGIMYASETGDTRANVTVKKKVTGIVQADQSFKFTATVEGDISEKEKTSDERRIFEKPEEYTVLNDGRDGNPAVVEFTLRDGCSVILEGIPVEATVTICEEGAEAYHTTYAWAEKNLQGEESTDGSEMQNHLQDQKTTSKKLNSSNETVICTNEFRFNEECSLEVWAHEPGRMQGAEMVSMNLNEMFQDVPGILSNIYNKDFYVEQEVLDTDKIETDSWTLTSVEKVEKNKRTAGFRYADSTFAMDLTSVIGAQKADMTGEVFDICDESGRWLIGDKDDDPELLFTLHNANALTKNTPAGILRLQMICEDGGVLTVNITIQRAPANIHLTIPMYVCMYGYGGDGKVVTPSPDAYGITNHSNCPVQITSVKGINSNWKLKESTSGLSAGELFLNLRDQVVTSKTMSIDGHSSWRIAAPLTEEDNDAGYQLSIPISAAIAGGNVNEEGESGACIVTYTAGIPEY